MTVQKLIDVLKMASKKKHSTVYLYEESSDQTFEIKGVGQFSFITDVFIEVVRTDSKRKRK